MEKPIVLTMGDPAGVGPEIIIKALLEGGLDRSGRPLLVAGDVEVLRRAAAVLGATVSFEPGTGMATHRLVTAGRSLPVRALSSLTAEQAPLAKASAPCGRAMLDYIEWACDACLAGDAAGMVTAPINKQAIRMAGSSFPGHTELLAERCNVPRVVMMLAGEKLRVCLVTTHISLAAVPEALTEEGILETVRITDASMRRFFALERPRLAVLSLNPHAGEGGLFGDEEQRLILPAIDRARAEGIGASGPHSADTLFHFAARGEYDAVICMYHDQGLIPLKLLHFEDGVNVTLGLPIVRTSVDHGTAYDLAGTGRASAASLVAALRVAEEMASAQGVRR